MKTIERSFKIEISWIGLIILIGIIIGTKLLIEVLFG